MIACAVLTLTATLQTGSVFAQDAEARKPDKDWPCKQILVREISLPAIWSGPSIDDVNWRKDTALAELVTRLAARRTPIETAEGAIADFAKSAGPDKQSRLVALFGGLFDTLNAERTDVIDGLIRFGQKRKKLAEKIRTENAQIQNSPEAAGPSAEAQQANPLSATLEFDLRIFDEGRQSLAYVCETPTLIEQRLFALARIIQNNLD
ncbi:MAG: hypothetical protein WDN46_23985 [Methylocella sp.]